MTPREYDELLLDMLTAACSCSDTPCHEAVDNMAMQPYQQVCTHLEAQGLLVKINDRIYTVVHKEDGQ